MIVFSPMSVEYIDHTGSDLFVANVARVSFNKRKDSFEEGDAKLLRYLASHKHTSPFRHTSISLRCKVPVFLARQLAKHQVGMSWNEVSRRYVDNGFEFYNPDGWKSRPDGSVKQGSGGHLGLKETSACDELLSRSTASCMSTYNLLLGLGVAPEEARMVLPQNMMVEFIWTGSLLAFHHLYNLRHSEGSQTVAKEFAALVSTVIAPLFPVSWGALQEVSK